MPNCTFYPIDDLSDEQIDQLRPTIATGLSAGADLRAYLSSPVVIKPQQVALIRTGFRVNLDAELVGLICPRSGLAAKERVTVLNAPGLIDADYAMELVVLLYNAGTKDYTVQPRDRVAQFLPMIRCASIHGAIQTGNKRVGGCGSTGNGDI